MGAKTVEPFSPPADIAADELTSPFWSALNQGVLSLQTCASCGKFRMPPSPYCPHCTSTQSSWRPLSGRARLYTYTISPIARRDPDSPVYVPALVTPLEAGGVRLFANIVGCSPEDLQVGMELELMGPTGDSTAPLFRPTAPARDASAQAGSVG